MYRLKKLAAVGLALAGLTGVGTGVALVAQVPTDDLSRAAPPADDPRPADDDRAAELNGPRLVLTPGPADGTITVAEFAGSPVRPIGAVTCDGRGMLRTYLARTRKDPAAPVVAVVERPADKAEAADRVAEDCTAAGFADVSVVDRPARGPKPALPPEAARPAADSPAAVPAYVIETPDVLKIEAFIRPPNEHDNNKPDRPPGDQTRNLPIQPVSGQYKVRPDGTVYLGLYGTVRVGGLTEPAAAAAIRDHLAPRISPESGGIAPKYVFVLLEVSQYESKRYYVVTEKAVEPNEREKAA